MCRTSPLRKTVREAAGTGPSRQRGGKLELAHHGKEPMMRGACGLSLLLLVLGFSCSLQDSNEDPVPWERTRLWQLLADGDGDLTEPLLQLGGPRNKKNTDPTSLFSVAKELQGFGKEKAGFRFRFGRREEGNEMEKSGSEMEKRSDGALGSLAEELNGYNRKKGGFSFRFGRR